MNMLYLIVAGLIGVGIGVILGAWFHDYIFVEVED